MAAAARKTADAGDGQKHTPYPYYSLSKALEVAEVVRDLGGANGEVQKPLIAQHMGIEESAPTLIGVLGAAKLYNLVEGRGSYRLSDTAKSFFYPTNENERHIARLQMVKGPPLFSALIDKFDGTRLPGPEVLVNILHREHRIAESWRPRAVSLFMSSLRESQLLDAGGFLRYKASLQAAGNGSMGGMKEPQTNVVDRPAAEQAPDPFDRTESRRSSRISDDVDVWSFRLGGNSVRLETSRELSFAAWRKLHQYVQILKPEEDGPGSD